MKSPEDWADELVATGKIVRACHVCGSTEYVSVPDGLRDIFPAGTRCARHFSHGLRYPPPPPAREACRAQMTWYADEGDKMGEYFCERMAHGPTLRHSASGATVFW